MVRDLGAIVSFALAAAVAPAMADDARVVSVYAAGSLHPALTAIGRAYESRTPGVQVHVTFGASGLLKERLLHGESADVFASANLEHPEELARAGRAGPVRRFAPSPSALSGPARHGLSRQLFGASTSSCKWSAMSRPERSSTSRQSAFARQGSIGWSTAAESHDRRLGAPGHALL